MKISKIFSLFLISIILISAKPNKRVPYNVIFIAIDDMNNWIGANGGQAITPNIDALAAKGINFTNAHCVTPACNPSRTAIMTGQRPETTGQFENAGNFRNNAGGKERTTLGQFLQSKGFETVAAGKVFHFPAGRAASPNPISDPISWSFQNKSETGISGDKQYLDEKNQAKWLEGALRKDFDTRKEPSYLSHSGVWGIANEPKEASGDWKNARFCADYLQKQHNKPFFLACGISRPHAPLIAPKEYFDMYPLDKIKMHELPENDMQDIPDIAKTNFSSEFTKLVRQKGELKNAVQAYLACMSFADACVGEVLKSLENSPYRDNTIVVFWSDHGWQLGHKNRWEKYSLWHQATNAPFIVYVPNQKGGVCNEAVSYLDIFPTLLDLMGFKKPDFLEGDSFSKQVKTPNKKRKIPAVITYPKGSHAVVLGDWHYIHYLDGSEELYNHKTDPNEYKNIALNSENKALIEKLKQHLPNQK
jgi:arylsulfatase A-like enzyme